MEHGSRTRLTTALVLVAVFGAGAMLGFAADSSLGAKTPVPTRTSAETSASTASDGADAETDADEAEGERRAPLFMKVDPNEEQLADIDAIVAEHRARTNSLHEEQRAEYRAGFRAILLETREAIKGVLSDAQAAEYQRVLNEWDAEAAARRDNGDDQN
jgi:hypothetical protein